jgi:hypothetical protein
MKFSISPLEPGGTRRSATRGPDVDASFRIECRQFAAPNRHQSAPAPAAYLPIVLRKLDLDKLSDRNKWTGDL